MKKILVTALLVLSSCSNQVEQRMEIAKLFPNAQTINQSRNSVSNFIVVDSTGSVYEISIIGLRINEVNLVYKNK